MDSLKEGGSICWRGFRSVPCCVTLLSVSRGLKHSCCFVFCWESVLPCWDRDKIQSLRMGLPGEISGAGRGPGCSSRESGSTQLHWPSWRGGREWGTSSWRAHQQRYEGAGHINCNCSCSDIPSSELGWRRCSIEGKSLKQSTLCSTSMC